MFYKQILICFIFLQTSIASFDFGRPDKYLICFFQQFKVLKCENSPIKENVKIYYFSNESDQKLEINITKNECPVPNTPIKIITHGWGSNTNNSWLTEMNMFYKRNGIKHVFGVDWSKDASDLFYLHSAADAKCVGHILGEFILQNLVNKCKFDLQDIHLIGHSLGAHVSGFAGKYVQENFSKTNGISKSNQIQRITGLDPAGPYFWKCDPEYRLDKGDATIVDVIHTDGFKFGCIDAIGDFDFYVNGGHAPQPGCFLLRKKRELTINISCSHSRATALYIESIISDGFIGKKCENELFYKFGQCNENTALIMGEHLNGSLDFSGAYHLKTNDQYPFAKFGQT